jgi:subtilisin family serine protease
MQGNLLMVGSVPLTELGLAVKLGVRPTLRSEQADTSSVLIRTSTALSHNLRYSKVLVSAGEWSMAPTENFTGEVVASYSDAELERAAPAVVLSSVGNGYALTFGFDLLSTVVNSEGAEIGQVVANALANYATVHLSLTSGPIGIASPASPNLEPLDLASPLFTEVSTVAHKFNEKGFTVLYSNLLYANSAGEFLGRLSLHGPLSLFVETFSSHVMVSYEREPVVSFPSGYCIPRFARPFFVSVCSIPPATLSWPPGWAPPQVSYYHLSPTEASRQDMGALYSVEHLLGVDQARSSYGLDGSGVTVAVVDSGFSRDFGLYPTPNGFHPYYEQFYSDLLTNRYYNHTVGLISANDDPVGHGTGIVANLLAVAPGIDLHMVPFGDITYQDAIAALDEVLRIAPDVLSCSWGFYVYTDATILAQLRELTRSGTIVVFAAGNMQLATWPAMEQCVVAVGGAYLDSSGGLQASNYSASGDSLEEDYDQWNVYPPGRIVPDVCGLVGQEPYGVLIEMPTESASSEDVEFAVNATDGTSPADGWWVASGTSSAAPQVAGLAALMKQTEPAMNSGVFKHIAMTTCTDVITGHSACGDSAAEGFDTATGAGLINVSRALWTLNLQVEYVGRTLPAGKSVHFNNFTGPYGLSYHIDTSGTNQFGFNFFGLLAARDGAVMTRQEGSSAGLRVVGWFRQYDTFSQSLWPGRRHLHLYVLPVDGSQILASTELLGANDGTAWKHVDKTITGASIPWGMVRIAIGREDAWQTDWQLTAEWAQVIVVPYEWTPRTIPSGKQYTFYPFATEMGIAYHIDTAGSFQYDFFFFGSADDAMFYNFKYSGLVPQKLSISGWFRQDDLFEGYYENYQPGQRYLDVYLLTPDAQWVLASCRILEWYDGDGWVYRRLVIFTTSLPIGWVLVAVGRKDDWSEDWGLVAEWCNLQITTWF